MPETSAACESLWIRKIMEELETPQKEETKIYCDSSSVIALSKDPAFHSRTKHMEIKHHFLKQHVAEGRVALISCRSEEQFADIFIKALTGNRFVILRAKLVVGGFNEGAGM